MDRKLFRIIESIRRLKEEMAAFGGVPTNNVGDGKIAGTFEAGDIPPVCNKKNRKKRYIFLGKGSRKKWMG